jgi:hypothetical protein
MPGNLEIEERVAQRFAESGFKHGKIEFRAPSFVPGETSLSVNGGSPVRLRPLHPTIFRPGNFKSREFESPLVYLGRGEPAVLERLKSVDLKGTVGLMDFDCGEAWQNFLRFGVKGFIFIAQDEYWPRETLTKVYNTEVAVPRFLVGKDDGAALKTLVQESGTAPVAKFRAEPSRWKPQTLRDLWVLIPGANEDLNKDIFVFTAPMDANCVVPELAQGAQAGANLFLLLRLLEDFKSRPPARSVLLAAVNAHTQNFLGERMLAWHLLAENSRVEATRDLLADRRRVQRVFMECYEKIRLRPETMKEDNDFLNKLRTLEDVSTGKRMILKTPLHDLARRNSNKLKTQIMDITLTDLSPEEKDRRIAELRQRDRQCINVLLVFNKINIRHRTELKDLTEPEVEILRGYVRQRVEEFRRSSELNLKDLENDGANGAVRQVLDGGRRVAMVITLDLAWQGEGLGFCSVNPTGRFDWSRSFGMNSTRIAKEIFESGKAPEAEGGAETEAGAAAAKEDRNQAKEAKPSGQTDTKGAQDARYGLFLDTMTNFGGLPQEHYFSVSESAISFFHAAQATPAASLKSAYAGAGRAFAPTDTFDNLDPGLVAETMAYLPKLFRAILADGKIATSAELPKPKPASPLWSIYLQTFKMDEFSPKPTPELEVPGSVAILYPNTKDVLVPPLIGGDVVNGYLTLTDSRASAFVYGVREYATGWNTMPSAAFQYDDDYMEVLHAVDMGRTQDQQANSNVYDLAEKIIPMFRCREFPLFERNDPSMVSARAISIGEIWVLGGRQNFVPQRFGVTGVKTKSKAIQPLVLGPVAVFMEQKDVQAKTDTLKLMTAQRLLALNASEEEAQGAGFVHPRQIGPDFFERAVQDMAVLNKARRDELSGVANQLVNDFIAEGDAAIAAVKEAEEKREHVGYLKSLFRAVGAESKAYGQIRSINQDMLKAIIFYMALMMPFCFFVQKLVFRFVRLEAQIVAFGTLFVLTYVVFRLIHPAFRIALTPEAIFVAFVLGAVGSFVTVIMHNRFEGEMTLLFRSYVMSAGEAAYATAGQQAMLIGVNNMKRRRIRTTLTTGTIVLVTFTMLAFSSVSRKMSPTVIPKADESPYTGLFYQWPGVSRMDEATLRVFQEMFTGEAQCVVRRWLFPQKGAKTPSFPMLTQASNGESAKMLAGLGLQAAERDFLAPMPILPGGRFFSSDDAAEVILPTAAAEALKIGADQVGQASLTFHGQELSVVGIIDEERFRYIKDLNGRALLPVLLEDKGEGSQSLEARDEAPGQDDTGITYIDPAQLLILPVGVARNLGAEPFSISVRFNDGAPMWDIMHRVLMVTSAKFFLGSRQAFTSGERGEVKTPAGVYYIGSNYRTSIGGASRLIIPLIIAGTIILNTMLGSVYERRNEIAVYNAVGLNPTHIGLFFLAEAFVYGVIGSVAGYLIGQVLALGLKYFEIVKDINVNFSSLMVVYVIFFTVSLVLLSTLYPAHVATRTAVPSGKRKWSLPRHDGTTMLVPFPFIYQPNVVAGVMFYLQEYFARYTEASLGEQIAQLAEVVSGTDGQGRDTYRLRYHIALAPYDLGVTQRVEFSAAYDDVVQSYRVMMTITRVSGQDSNWVTTNRPFLERMRRHLLQWRNLDPTQHAAYRERAKEFFAGTGAVMRNA